MTICIYIHINIYTLHTHTKDEEISLTMIVFPAFATDRWLDVDALATALRFLGVLAMGGARVGLGVVTVEVVPTIARGSAVGLCAAHAAVGEMCAPLLAMVVRRRGNREEKKSICSVSLTVT